MRYRLESLFIGTFTLLLLVSIFLLKVSIGLNWGDTLSLIVEIFQSSGLIDLTGFSYFEKILVFAISLAWAAVELGIIVFFVTLILQYIFKKQQEIEERLTDFIAQYNVRRIFTIVFVSVLFFSTIIIRTIERVSWLDSVYFIIITISTVGFGDITATHPITKVVTIILVLNGITFIGLSSQVIIDRIVNLQLSRQYALPNKPLQLTNHIIIAGYGSKGRRLAQLFIERGYKVIIIERDDDRANLAKINGFEVINSDITKPALLEIISLKDAAGLFLLLSNDNLVIQAGIIARSIAPELDIYGEFLSVPTYNIARYAGINKPISLFVFMTNELQNYFTHEDMRVVQNIKDLRQQESNLAFIQVPIDFDYEGMFDNPLVIGEVSEGFNEIYLDRHLALEYERPSVHTTHLLIGIDREELDEKLKIDQREQSDVDRLIFAGYDSLIESLIERLDFPEENIIVLWQNQEDLEALQQKPYKKYQWTLENGHQLLEQMVKDRDLIICTFNDITSSLIIGVTIRNLKRQTKDTEKKDLDSIKIIQLVPYEYDIDPLMKVGAEVVFTPQQIISSAILSQFMKENHISPSMVFTNGHLYEHLVNPDDFFDGKTIVEMRRKRYNVLYIREPETNRFTRPNDENYKISEGDRVLIYIKNIQKERLDRLR